MKRLASIMLMAIFMAVIFTTAVTAAGPSNGITGWVLSDSGNNIQVKIIQYPRITITSTGNNHDQFAMRELRLQEIILEMDLASAQKYFQYFKDGGVIPELVLNGVNENRPVLKITLESCTICGFTVDELFVGRSSTPLKAAIKLIAGKITTTKLNTPGTPLQVTPIKKLDMAKIFINDTECTGYASLSGIEGFLLMYNNADEMVYGAAQYNNTRMLIDYSKIGTLPDWLASCDGNFDYTTSANPQCKLRYEMSSTTSDDKLSFEVNLDTVAQEFVESTGREAMVKYTFRVFDLSFLTPSEAADSTPPAPVNLFIKGSSLNALREHNWAGKWVTSFGKMSLKQNGTKVTGEYGNPIETLEGTASGSKLAGTWRDSLSSGKFEFIMAADGKSFTGMMYKQAIGDRGTFEWNGDRE